jgi:crotonobetainyl-CoA:carnitine CoA-transferase CaiB-like acyl-CoA transferase
MLADYGADVVWIEPPGGDPIRRREPAAASVFNRGKRAIELDLGDPAAVATVLELADRADVFIESWAPGEADRMGLGYATLHTRNPQLVYVSISGHGEAGRDADLPGEEPIVYAVLGSMSGQLGHRPGPIFMGIPFASTGAAYLAVIGALAAIHRREQDGVGRHVCTSLADGALAYHSMMWGESDESVARQTASGQDDVDPLQLSRKSRTITRSFECKDGSYIGIHTGAVGAFGRAMQLLGLDDRIPPSATGLDLGQPLTDEQIPVLEEEVPKIFLTRDREEWIKVFMAADVCAVEHLHPTEVYDTPQAQHNDIVVELDDPALGPVRQVDVGAKLSASPGQPAGPAPAVGQHTEEVLTGLAGWPKPAPSGSVPTPDRRPLLDGVRILDVGQYYAGPYSSRLLADLGAEVIKVEPLLGDQLRGIERPFYSGQAKKKSLAANLKDPAFRRW